jgi:hypothetical protein
MATGGLLPVSLHGFRWRRVVDLSPSGLRTKADATARRRLSRSPRRSCAGSWTAPGEENSHTEWTGRRALDPNPGKIRCEGPGLERIPWSPGPPTTQQLAYAALVQAHSIMLDDLLAQIDAAPSDNPVLLRIGTGELGAKICSCCRRVRTKVQGTGRKRVRPPYRDKPSSLFDRAHDAHIHRRLRRRNNQCAYLSSPLGGFMLKDDGRIVHVCAVPAAYVRIDSRLIVWLIKQAAHMSAALRAA